MAENKNEYAMLMTQEMGKPIVQAEAEIDKCIKHLDYYVKNSERFLEDEQLKLALPGHEGTIVHQPIGPILSINPWNFPFWIPFCTIIPPLVLGNSVMLKHSPSTPLCALALNEAFSEAGFGKGEY